MSRMGNDESYMVVINVAGSEAKVNLTVFSSTLEKSATVATAAPNSRFHVG